MLAVLCLVAALHGQEEPAEVRPEDYATVKGIVVDALTEAPLAKAQVSMRRTGRGARQRLSATTGAGGEFTINNVEPGEYRLSAEKNRYARADYGARRPGAQGQTLTVGAGAQLNGIGFKLAPAAVVTGRVLDSDGESMADVQVTAMRFRYIRGSRQLAPSGRGAGTNDLGEYRLFGLDPGEYYIAATARAVRFQGRPGADPTEDRTHPTLYFPGVMDPAQAAPIRLRPGQEQGSVDFRMSMVRASRVKGRVTMADGNPLPRNVSVVLLPASGVFFGGGARPSGGVNSNTGVFEVAGVLPGSYVVMASTRGRGRSRLFGRQTVEIGNDTVEEIVVQLNEPLTQTGRIETEGQAPNDFQIDDLRVSLIADGMMWGGGNGDVSEKGSFEVDGLAPSGYRVQISGLPQAAYLKEAAADDRDVMDSGLDLGNGAAGELKLVVSFNGGTVNGAVKDDEGNPSASATVVLVPEMDKRKRQDLYKRAVTDELGQVSVNGIAPGEYKLFAFDYVEPGAYYDPAFLSAYEDSGEEVEIEEGAQAVVDLEVIPET